MIPNYEGCLTCPLKDRPPVLGKRPEPKDYMIIGEAPGREEAAKKHPFVGRSGDILWTTLLKLDPKISRSQVHVTNIVICHPEGNATPTSMSIESCRDRLYEEIRIVQPKKILLLGSTASRAILGQSITKVRGLGTMMNLDGLETFVVATYHPAALLRDPDLFRDFADDVVKWAKNDEPISAPMTSVYIPTTPEEALDLLLWFGSATSLSCDIETTGFSPRTDSILSVGFGAMVDEETGATINVIVPIELMSDPSVDLEIKHLLSTWEGDIVFHNIKFDMGFLRTRYGMDLTPYRAWDTLLMRYAQDERGSEDSGTGRSYGSLGLKDIARVRYDIPDYHFDFTSFFATPPESRDWRRFYHYQALDTHITIRLFYALKDELVEESPRLIDLVREFLVPGALAFCNVELRGIPIDREYLLDLRATTSDLVESLISDLQKISGRPNLNPNSPKQVKEIFLEDNVPYVSGERSILQMMMKNASLPDKHREFIPKLLDFRQMTKILQTYVEGMLKRCDSEGRIHSDFRLSGTDTGRLSCRNPNLQNIPTIMGPQIKRAFIAPGGWKIVNADYSQLELRVAAYVSRDEGLIAAFQKGIDIHRWVASFTFNKPLDEITAFERYMAKYVDFGILYGRSARGLTEGFEAEYIFEMTGRQMTNEWADSIQLSFFGAFPMLKTYIDNQHKFVREHGYIEGPTGRRRRFRFIDRFSVGSVERKSVNTPIQGFASDMTLTAIIKLDRLLPPDRGYVVSSVHDSAMFLLRDDYLEEGVALIREVMEVPPVVFPAFDIPLRVDIGFGQSWDQAKD